MDKYDVLVETYGLEYLLEFYGVDDSQVLRLLEVDGILDFEDFTYDEMEVNDDE